MSFFTKSMLRESLSEAKSHRVMLNSMDLIKSVDDGDLFDVFLSHSYKDRIYISKLKKYIEINIGLSCYVDWITEPGVLGRDDVNIDTAKILKKRMRQSQSLVFCTSDNSPDSKWMPWELGYFDAHKGSVAVLPIVDEGQEFRGQEYLSLYPYIDKTDKILWVNDGKGGYVNMKEWLGGKMPYKRS